MKQGRMDLQWIDIGCSVFRIVPFEIENIFEFFRGFHNALFCSLQPKVSFLILKMIELYKIKRAKSNYFDCIDLLFIRLVSLRFLVFITTSHYTVFICVSFTVIIPSVITVSIPLLLLTARTTSFASNSRFLVLDSVKSIIPLFFLALNFLCSPFSFLLAPVYLSCIQNALG